MKKLILILLLFLYIWANWNTDVYADTLSGMRTKIRETIRDKGPSSTEYRFSDTTLNNWLNEAQIRIIKETHCMSTRYTIYTITGTREYELPANYLEMEKAYIVNSDSTNTYTRLNRTEIDILDKSLLEWEDADNNEPTDYYVRTTSYNVVIGLFPEPDLLHSGTGYLRLDFIIKIGTMSADGDIPFNGVSYMYPYHYMLIDYTIAKCLRIGLSIADWVDALKKDLLKNTDKIGKLKFRRR